MRQNMTYINCQSKKKSALETRVLRYSVTDAAKMLSDYIAAGWVIYDMTIEGGLTNLASRTAGKYVCLFRNTSAAALTVPLASITPHTSVLIMSVVTDDYNNISSIASLTIALGAGDYDDKLVLGYGTYTAITGNGAQGIQVYSCDITNAANLYLKDIGFDSCKITTSKIIDIILYTYYKLSNCIITNTAASSIYYFGYGLAYSSETKDTIESCKFVNFKTYSQLRIAGKYYSRAYGMTNVLIDDCEIAISNAQPINPGGVYQRGSYISKKNSYIDLVDLYSATGDVQDSQHSCCAYYNNGIYFAYRDKQNSDKLSVIKFDYTINTWSTIGSKGFSAAAHLFYSPFTGQMAIDSAGNIYVLSNQGGSYCLMYKWNGATWAEVAGTNLAISSEASLGITSANNVVVAYSDSGNAGKISVKYYSGSAWSTVASAASASAGYCPQVLCTGTAVVVIYAMVYNVSYYQISYRRGTVASLAAAVSVDTGITWGDGGGKSFVSCSDYLGVIYITYLTHPSSYSWKTYKVSTADSLTEIIHYDIPAVSTSMLIIYSVFSDVYYIYGNSVYKYQSSNIWVLQNTIANTITAKMNSYNGTVPLMCGYNTNASGFQIYLLTQNSVNNYLIKPYSGNGEVAWNNYDLNTTDINQEANDSLLSGDISIEYLTDPGQYGTITKRNYNINFGENFAIPDVLKYFGYDDWKIVRSPEAQTALLGKKTINLSLFNSDGTTAYTYLNDENFIILAVDGSANEYKFMWYAGALYGSIYCDFNPGTTYTITKCFQIWVPPVNISGLRNIYNMSNSFVSGSIMFDNRDNEVVLK